MSIHSKGVQPEPNRFLVLCVWRGQGSLKSMDVLVVIEIVDTFYKSFSDKDV
jgi:hypothetical protein